MKVLNTLLFSILWGGVSAQVGIGTTTPSNDLDVEGSGAAATAIDINNKSTGDPKINFQLNDVSKFSIGVDNSDAAKFKIGTSALETNTRFTIDASGNVGIGTTSPTTKLHLDGTFRLVDGNQSNGKVLTSDANGVATWQTASGGSLPAGTSGQTLRHDGTNWVANSNIFNNGTNVGIGTTSPLSPFQVNSSSCGANVYSRGISNFYFNTSQCSGGFMAYKARGTEASPTTVANADGMGGFWMGGHDGTNYLTTASILSFANGTIATGSIPTDIAFQTGSTNNGMTEKMRLTSAGLLGIGNTSPTAKLDVDGSAIFNESGAATNFRVESDGNANMLFVNGTTNGVGIGTATPNAALQLGNAEGNRRIVVFENANDNHQFCGFGLNSGEFRYQVGNSGTHHIFYAGTSSTTSTELMRIQANGRVGIGMTPSTNLLEVNGAASKTAAGDWLANSDARLKKDIKQMDSKAVLDKMLALKGITYYWNDTVTGSKRPTQLQYGFTAQNIQEVFPILVEEDNLGYLQTAYGTYDAMYVESMRALQQQIDAQQAIIEAQKKSNDAQKAEIDALKVNALKVADLENKMNAMLLLLNNKQELTVKQ